MRLAPMLVIPLSCMVLLGAAAGQGHAQWVNLERTFGTSDQLANVNLDIPGCDGNTEDDPGGLVIRNHDGNNAHRKTIVLQQAELFWHGNVLLTCSSTKVKIYDAYTGGNQITFDGTDNKFSNDDLPKTLYVEGVDGSGSMRDVEIKLAVATVPTHFDTVKFTVLWVDVTSQYGGNMPDDNGAKSNYNSVVCPDGSSAATLGPHFFVTTGSPFDQNAAWGIGCLYRGQVHPSNFVPAQFGGTFLLRRTLDSGAYYGGANGETAGDPVTAHQDVENPAARDDDPQSGGSNGWIYDWDFPGLYAFYAAETDIIRVRLNFTEYAEYQGHRCSNNLQAFTRQSYHKTGRTQLGANFSTGSGTFTLTDTNSTWQNDWWQWGAIYIGWGKNEDRMVSTNSNHQVTVTKQWAPALDARGDLYKLTAGNAWTAINDKSHDNINDNESNDGVTPTSADLQ